MATWGYTTQNGPATWGNDFPIAHGKRQSPIDVIPGQAAFNADLASNPIAVKYVKENAKNIVNTGRSCQVNFDSTGSSLQGGPLKHKHQLQQFHFHWGKTSDVGSEHTVDGKMYAAELHLVHWDSEKCKSFEEACGNDGLCVLGIFLKAGTEHAGLKKLTDMFPKLKHKDNTSELADGIDPATLLPSDTTKFWTYAGSLTTPPLLECVTWVVFQEPIEVSEAQLQAFRDLVQHGEGQDPIQDEFCSCIMNNYRPPQPLHERKVEASFSAGQ